MRHTYFLLMMAWIFGAFGCETNSTDRSLTLEGYYKLGMPEINKSWDGGEYAKSNEVLSRMKWEQPFSFPIKESSKSGKMYSKLVSHEIMNFVDDETIPLNERAMKLLDVLNVFESWIDLYTNFGNPKQYYRRELLDLQLHAICVRQEMIYIADKILKSDDPNDIRMRYGDSSIRRMYVAGLVKSIEFQSHSSQFLKEDIDIVADSIANGILQNKSWMDSLELINLQNALNVAIDSVDSEFAKNKYRSILDAL